ncbi:MAG: FKBP-type peptidyl-prolyl cis-trans isomerase [Gammaproteobacteria bacterium]|nr:FKBP-type peptidyl-prolyl cis-trans isomerase [Gammaproteobacteria bacterium]MCF6230032.1 FKBP-type peptidyl-prolyl cis-trans isomerase [Gammaproteobacteria bacterium]
MKSRVFIAISLLLALPLQAEIALDTQDKKISYTVGQQIGQQLLMEKIPVDREALFKGIADFLDSNEPQLGFSIQQQTVAEFRERKERLIEEERRRNLLQGQAYMKANATKRGVEITESGLQYRIITPGSGPRPHAKDRISVHYEGRLIDGTVFDNSYSRGNPLVMQVEQNMPGWQEVLPLMSAGSKWQVTIPAHLAYGEEGFDEQIPPNAVLVFDIELFEVLAQ